MTYPNSPLEANKLKLVISQKKMIYAIWNNKGGVGKTFLTFMMAGEYAQAHPSTPVVIVDLCPQANVSEIVLGGNGKGSAVLTTLLNQSKRQTIGGYFDERVASPQISPKIGMTYLINPFQSQYNTELPQNLFIIVGDPSLELQAQAINQISVQTLPEDSWKNVHRWVIDLIDDIKKKLGENTMFFIDCNPSFASYTELGILASERLIVPCSADGSSARAIDNIGRLIYGVNVPPQYRKANFFQNSKTYNFKLPEIHIIMLNRSTQYGERASKGFSAMFDEIKRRTDSLVKTGTVPFSSLSNHYVDIPDNHTLSIICSHQGLTISTLKPATQYDVHGKTTIVPKDSYTTYKNAMDILVSQL